jgi:hypothetical protein
LSEISCPICVGDEFSVELHENVKIETNKINIDFLIIFLMIVSSIKIINLIILSINFFYLILVNLNSAGIIFVQFYWLF